MEQPRYLIDSNAIIDFLGQNFSTAGMRFMEKVIDIVPNISVVSKIEVLCFDSPNEHYQILVDFMEDANVFNLTEDVINASIVIRKTHRTKLPDAIIAATAIVNNLTLITRNIKDFQNVANLSLLDPHTL